VRQLIITEISKNQNTRLILILNHKKHLKKVGHKSLESYREKYQLMNLDGFPFKSLKLFLSSVNMIFYSYQSADQLGCCLDFNFKPYKNLNIKEILAIFKEKVNSMKTKL
jgi:hypothetical protein